MIGVSFMGNMITRKCACCKGVIEIDVNDIRDVVYFQDKYYHYDCFESMATQKAASKRGKPQMWQDALDQIWELEAETKSALEQFIARDELNAWLLSNYDIVMVPSYFWQLVADLEKGVYKRQRCKPVSIGTLHSMWIWGQKRLNKIAVDNKTNRKGPSNDSDRLRYDLAILLSHTNDYKKYQNRVRAEKSEAQMYAKKEDKSINYSEINKVKEASKKQIENDITDILDEIFG